MGRSSIYGSLVVLLVVVNAAVAKVQDYFLWDDWGGTWADAEKVLPDGYPGAGTGDDYMCWAAAASNTLEWTGWHGPGDLTNTDAIFGYFQDHWTDDGMPFSVGMGTAWKWWFDGISVATGATRVDVPGGGFYSTADFADSYHVRVSDSRNGRESMVAIDQFLHAGYGTMLDITPLCGDGHVITVWGLQYETDPTINPYYYNGIWVTDSDDDMDNPPYPDNLQYWSIAAYGTTGAARWIVWSDADMYAPDSYGGFLASVYGLERNPDYALVPVPSAVLLGAIGLLYSGRRLKRRTA
ncbi:MAG: hypothetical protein KBE65_21355 [Phycisphaerae bacterium]|nr:hypothetical protein [Phycisphaerae bacterium]